MRVHFLTLQLASGGHTLHPCPLRAHPGLPRLSPNHMGSVHSLDLQQAESAQLPDSRECLRPPPGSPPPVPCQGLSFLWAEGAGGRVPWAQWALSCPMLAWLHPSVTVTLLLPSFLYLFFNNKGIKRS